MKNQALFALITLATLSSCGEHKSQRTENMAQATIAQPTDLMENPESFLVDYKVVDIVNDNYMIVQALGVNYQDEYNVRFSPCYQQGKTPVNVGDTIRALAENIAGKDYRRTFPPCQK
ncbi:MAG: hypothetical protein R3B55_00135 [Candidatus Paceibacterota bacterium]